MMRAGRAEECELELEKHYEEELPSIRDVLFDQFPKRKAFLEEAFKLHDEERYVSAISRFLIQSDGIGESIFGASPISKRKKWLASSWKSADIAYGANQCHGPK